MLVTTILAGGHREHQILGAAASVERFTDLFLLLRSDSSADAAIATMQAVHRNCVVVNAPQADFRCSVARNKALEAAHRAGASWCLMLDTDMRVEAPGVDVKAFLETTTTNTVSVDTGGLWRAKPLFFRMPAIGTWRDDPHEWYDAPSEPETLLPRARCWEIAKTHGEQISLSESVIRQLTDGRELTVRNQWYLADAYLRTGQVDLGIELYRTCATKCRTDWAGSCFWHIAKAEFDRQNWEGCREACVEGSDHCPEYPEFPWLAGVALVFHELPAPAIIMACRAIELAPAALTQTRTWQHLPAWYEGPYDVLYWAWRALGNVEQMVEAKVQLELKLAEREARAKLR